MQTYGKLSGAGLVVLGDHTRTDTEEILMNESKSTYYKPQIK